MPIINVQIAKGRSAETKQELCEKITKTVCEVLEVEQDWVTVLFTEYERENWATGGVLHSVKFKEGFGRQGTENRGP